MRRGGGREHRKASKKEKSNVLGKKTYFRGGRKERTERIGIFPLCKTKKKFLSHKGRKRGSRGSRRESSKGGGKDQPGGRESFYLKKKGLFLKGGKKGKKKMRSLPSIRLPIEEEI